MQTQIAETITPPPCATDALRRHPLWANCRTDTIDLLLRHSERRVYAQREKLVEEGTSAQHLHVVLSGAVEQFSRYRRHETEFALVEPPHAFIVAAVLTERLHLTSARAFEPSELLLIPAIAMRKAFDTDEVFARKIAIEIAHSYRAITCELKSQTLLTSLERVAIWLVERDEATGGGHVVRIPYDKRDLAARLGMVPEVFSRCLAALAKNEILVRGAIIEIRDSDALRRLAAPQPPMFCPNE